MTTTAMIASLEPLKASWRQNRYRRSRFSLVPPPSSNSSSPLPTSQSSSLLSSCPLLTSRTLESPRSSFSTTSTNIPPRLTSSVPASTCNSRSLSPSVTSPSKPSSFDPRSIPSTAAPRFPPHFLLFFYYYHHRQRLMVMMMMEAGSSSVPRTLSSSVSSILQSSNAFSLASSRCLLHQNTPRNVRAMMRYSERALARADFSSFSSRRFRRPRCYCS